MRKIGDNEILLLSYSLQRVVDVGRFTACVVGSTLDVLRKTKLIRKNLEDTYTNSHKKTLVLFSRWLNQEAE